MVQPLKNCSTCACTYMQYMSANLNASKTEIQGWCFSLDIRTQESQPWISIYTRSSNRPECPLQLPTEQCQSHKTLISGLRGPCVTGYTTIVWLGSSLVWIGLCLYHKKFALILFSTEEIVPKYLTYFRGHYYSVPSPNTILISVNLIPSNGSQWWDDNYMYL